jgi:hypothetical protein
LVHGEGVSWISLVRHLFTSSFTFPPYQRIGDAKHSGDDNLFPRPRKVSGSPSPWRLIHFALKSFREAEARNYFCG